jgi:hypothetical protein
VAFVDADDWVDLNMFEDLYRAAILNAVEVSQCGYAEVFEDSGRIDQYPTAWGGTEDNGRSGIVFDVRSYLTVKPTIWRRIYSRNLLFSNDLFFAEKLRRFDDLPFQFEVLSRIKSMAIIPDCYYYYRQEREGQDISVRDRRLFVHFPIFDILKTRVMSWCDFDVEKNIIKSKINTHLWALSRIDAKLFFMYLGQASFDICKNNLRASRLDVFKLALNMNLKNIFAVIVLIGFSFFVKKKDVACD